MNELMIFNNPEFGEVRTIEHNGETWFIGKDVARALGYSNTRKALDDHVDLEDKMQGDGVTIRDSIGREQHPTIINEFGVYSLILSSELPSAKKFKRWVTHEVIPSIRRKGYYSAISDEQLAKALVESLSNEWKLDNVIIPALREGDIDQSMLVAKYMGMTYQEYEGNAKLLRKSAQNLSAKRTLSRWGESAFTRDDIPEPYKDWPITLLAISKMKKRHAKDGWFAEYCGTLYFNKYGYESILEYLEIQKAISSEEAAKWKSQILF